MLLGNMYVDNVMKGILRSDELWFVILPFFGDVYHAMHGILRRDESQIVTLLFRSLLVHKSNWTKRRNSENP